MSQLDPEFNDFLFAPICDDRNGMVLSDADGYAYSRYCQLFREFERRLSFFLRWRDWTSTPWQEAAQLAGLPGEAAVRRLTGLIAALPDGPSASLNPGTIAARLIAHLPRRNRPNTVSHKSLFSVPAAINPWTVAYVVFMVFALGAQLIAASHQPPAQADKAHAPTTSMVSPPRLPPPGTGQ